MIEKEQCPVCHRMIQTHNMTLHHWLPQCQGGTIDNTMRLCETCHQTLHFIIPINEVINYKTPEQLMENWIYKIYVEWIRGIDHDKTIKTKKVIRYCMPNYVYHGFLKKIRKKEHAA